MFDVEVHRPAWVKAGKLGSDTLVANEWLVTNGLGGYASSTIGGVMTRKYHGYLVASLPAPLGRMVMLQNLQTTLRFAEGRDTGLAGEELAEHPIRLPAEYLRDFRLELGMPVWEFEVDGVRLEKRVVMPHGQNSVHVHYRRLDTSDTACTLVLRPFVHFRSYEEPVSVARPAPLVTLEGTRVEIHPATELPPLRLDVHGGDKPVAFAAHELRVSEVMYRMERDRGYESKGEVWSPGEFTLPFSAACEATFIASTESWGVISALPPDRAMTAESERRRGVLRLGGAATRDPVAAMLTLAADQFIISPAGRVEDEARARAAGDEARTVIAGYHWFTDWGRDTMISLEGLALNTGRHREAGSILRTFAYYVRDGLIPNMFPDGANEGLYHTADATLWFFHAVHRYVQTTNDRRTLAAFLPKLRDIVEHHVRGTRFGIGVDPADGLLAQGAPGYQLTWMDAKVGDWVVTPRRGKAVEINALWYNALRLMADWHREDGDTAAATQFDEYAARVRESFNRRFWYESGGYLYDVVDAESQAGGPDPSCRPNQIFAISLDHPVLDESRWVPVLETVRTRLLTPVGLRSLAPGSPDYKAQYFGDLRTRDAAYHQGTVWGWLIGPFVDAWLRVHPNDLAGARGCLTGLVTHLDWYGVGSLAEVFDAEPPYTPRGCIAQAWSVAEVMRAWCKTAGDG
ncbi:MAG TPA: amylo-alpha-1,6-glucosidase [Gemmatimonadaceae bacterium]|jgi:predicted glycogen debranching enzyme